MQDVRKMFETGGQCVVSVPKELRDELGIDDGSHVRLDVDDGRLVAVPVRFAEA
jgi:bifunctional DNA-binding transcriptional regulator/antitoxin component of YhaV-PrlF toxin-antitoxin module